MQQTDLEKSSRWYAGAGCVFTEDFIRKHVGAERMKAIDMTGAYIYKAEKPMPCIFVCFGAGGSWLPNMPITKHTTVNRTEAESFRMGTFMHQIDPDNKYHVRSWHFHVDLAEVRVLRRPSDEEIARLQLKYRDEKKYNITPKSRRAAMMAASKRAEPERLQREIRALDRRRYTSAGILPPPERAKDASYLAVIKGEPRKVHRVGKQKIDDYHSDTSDDEQKPWNWSPGEERRRESLSLFGDDEDDEKKEEDDELGDACIFEEGPAGEDEYTTAPAQKHPRQTSTNSKSGTTTLERVLRAMRAQSRQKRQRL